MTTKKTINGGILYMATHCGECPFLKYEDTDGYGICDIIGIESNCSLVCAFEKQCELTKEQAVKVLHHTQKWRRGAKVGMPPPALLGYRYWNTSIKTKD